jgi:hypothetical protein
VALVIHAYAHAKFLAAKLIAGKFQSTRRSSEPRMTPETSQSPSATYIIHPPSERASYLRRVVLGQHPEGLPVRGEGLVESALLGVERAQLEERLYPRRLVGLFVLEGRAVEGGARPQDSRGFSAPADRDQRRSQVHVGLCGVRRGATKSFF